MTEPSQRAKQLTVVKGVIAGMSGVALVGGGAFMAASPASLETAGDRLAFAARFAPFSALMLLFGIGAVANTRFATESINPLAVPDTGRILVHCRYVDNTLQQLVLHFVATVGLAAYGGPVALRLIPALTACFVLGRAVFWIGYLRDPMMRGPGFTMTFQPTMLTLVYLAYRGVHDLVR